MSKLIIAYTHEPQLTYQVGKSSQTAGYAWFRGEHCNFHPSNKDLRRVTEVTEQFVKGWAPPVPVIGPHTRVSVFGSCFARHIGEWLSRRNYSILTRKDGENEGIYVVRYGEGMVNTFALRQQFEWAFEGKTFEEELWHGYDARAFGYDEEVRQKTKSVFDQTEVFVITLGLSEVWYDEVTGGVFWRAVPKEKYDASRHKFRVSTVEENKENIRAIYDLISRHRPTAEIIFTLSPIPLVATFRSVSCLTANSVSKAILRASLDEVLREVPGRNRAYYWPSYEMVLDLFDNRWLEDRRHVRPEILEFIMTLFESVWCHGNPRVSLEKAWARARFSCANLPEFLKKLLNPALSVLNR
jgi:hypothetical protein